MTGHAVDRRALLRGGGAALTVEALSTDFVEKLR